MLLKGSLSLPLDNIVHRNSGRLGRFEVSYDPALQGYRCLGVSPIGDVSSYHYKVRKGKPDKSVSILSRFQGRAVLAHLQEGGGARC